VKITQVSTGATYTTVTQSAGGYQMDLAAGTYTATFSAAGFASTTSTFSIGANNVKLDWIDPVLSSDTPPPPPPPPPPPGPSTVGTAASDTYNGTSGNDVFDGVGGSDFIFGGTGDDRLTGGAGNDAIHGGLGRDTLTGGAGSDKFYFDTAIGFGNVDQITDFSTVYDRIGLENSVFTAFASTGTMSSSAFYKGAAAHDATDRIIYNSSTGQLFYDADGTGAVAPVQIAELATGLSLNYSDFFIV